MKPVLLPWLAAALLAAVVGWALTAGASSPEKASPAEAVQANGAGHSAHGYGGLPDPATLGGPFSLTDHHGRAITERDYRGRYMLLYFGYTRCLESCPLALRTIDQTLDRLGDAAKKIRPLFVSFDERDKIDDLAAYVSEIDPRIVGLTGTRKQIYDIGRTFRVRREHAHITQTKEPGHHRVNHTTWIFLVDPDGRTLDFYYHTIHPNELAERIRKHLAPTGAQPTSAPR